MIKRALILTVILNFGILPSFANFYNSSANPCSYDSNKTIKAESSYILDTTITTQKYWNDNLMYFNKYSPLFMLSNSELYDLIQKEQSAESADLEKKINDALTDKDYSLALNLLNDLIAQEPYNAYAFYQKGEIYSQKKDFDSAMKNYVAALKINPASQQCYLSIAKILEPTNKELAQKYYEKAKTE